MLRYCHPEESWQAIGEIWNVETDRAALLIPDRNTIPFHVQSGNTVYLPPLFLPAGKIWISTLQPIPNREGAVRFRLQSVECNSSMTMEESSSGKNISLPIPETLFTLCPITQIHYLNFELPSDSLLNISITALTPNVTLLWAISRDPLKGDLPVDAVTSSHVWLSTNRYYLAVRSFSGDDPTIGVPSSASYTLSIGVTPFTSNPACMNATPDATVNPADRSMVLQVCSASVAPRVNISFTTARLLVPQRGYRTFIDSVAGPAATSFLMLVSKPSKLRAGNFTITFVPDMATPELAVSLGEPTTIEEDSFEPNDTPEIATSLSLTGEVVFANLVAMDVDYWHLTLGNFSSDTDLLNVSTNATRLELISENGSVLYSNCFRCVCFNLSSLCTCGSSGACPPPSPTTALIRLQPATTYYLRVRATDSFEFVPETYWISLQSVNEKSLLASLHTPLDPVQFLPPELDCLTLGTRCV